LNVTSKCLDQARKLTGHVYVEKLEDTKEVIRNRTNRQYNDQTKMEKQYDLHNTAQKTIDKKQI
jgi:hypothetical protein